MLASALSVALDRAPDPGPEVVDGVPCCRNCGEPIPLRRLAALPGVGLCVDCAE